MRVENLLDLARKELLTAAVDHLLEPPDDAHVARAVYDAEIAGAEPAVSGEELGIRGGILVVAEVHRRPFGGDLALGAGRHVTAVLVDGPQLPSRRRAAGRARGRPRGGLQARGGVKARVGRA